ncbi:MAG: FtsW/RodA/SpoVE family cell cycle protein, partial [Anaeroplasma sp.]
MHDRDFIFAIIVEELGIILILLFGYLIYSGIKLAKHTKDLFASYLSFG